MSTRPKILRILNRFNLGGPVNNASYLSKYLDDEFETLLIGGQKLPSEESSLFIPEELGLKPHVIQNMKRSVGPMSDYAAYKEISSLIDEFKPDIVHTHASKAGALGRIAANRNGVPNIVHTFHGHVFEHYFGPLKTKVLLSTERYLAGISNKIVAISEKQKIDLSEKFSICQPEKIEVVNLGFELDKFTQDKEEKRKAFREKYAIEDDEIVIGIVGRLAPIKNHELFIKAFKKLKNKYENVRAVIIGDGELRDDLERLSAVNGLIGGEKDSIIFTSWITQMHEALPGLDIVALTSKNEGTPVSLIEAQAAGVPVVSTNVGGVTDIVGENCGIITENDNEVELINALDHLVKSEEKRTDMGKNGTDWAMSKFTADRLASDMKSLYFKLLDAKN